MFLEELSPLFQKITQHPVSFLGGFFSGVLRLNLNDDPVKTWLDQQTSANTTTVPTTGGDNGKAKGPQQITID